jgi:hypothetical protein
VRQIAGALGRFGATMDVGEAASAAQAIRHRKRRSQSAAGQIRV